MKQEIPHPDWPRRETLPTEVAKAIVEHFFIAGALSPGDRLPSERALAESLGVGRGVVREALKSLGLLGLIEVRLGDGTYLSNPNGELLTRVIEWGLLLGERRVTDLVEARAIVEVDTARLAALRRSNDDVNDLQVLMARMKNATSAKAYVDADIDFHLRIAKASGNSVLADMVSSIQSLLRVWIGRVIEASDDWSTTTREHEAVFRALRRADSAEAERAMATHMERARDRLFKTFPNEAEGQGAVAGSTENSVLM
jgi:GntR family transcriptional regulator, transcriptional repressor for pyruvate dehydrogenase complex